MVGQSRTMTSSNWSIWWRTSRHRTTAATWASFRTKERWELALAQLCSPPQTSPPNSKISRWCSITTLTMLLNQTMEGGHLFQSTRIASSSATTIATMVVVLHLWHNTLTRQRRPASSQLTRRRKVEARCAKAPSISNKPTITSRTPASATTQCHSTCRGVIMVGQAATTTITLVVETQLQPSPSEKLRTFRVLESSTQSWNFRRSSSHSTESMSPWQKRRLLRASSMST